MCLVSHFLPALGEERKFLVEFGGGLNREGRAKFNVGLVSERIAESDADGHFARVFAENFADELNINGIVAGREQRDAVEGTLLSVFFASVRGE